MTDEEMKNIISKVARDAVEGELANRFFPQIDALPAENQDRFYQLMEQARVSVTWDGGKP